MLLSILKLKKLGWKPSLNSKDAVRETVKGKIKQMTETAK
jgi:nucleoside-diphosphate-sugar epimerase